MTDSTHHARLHRFTPDGCVFALLAVEGFLLLSAWFHWFPFNQHKGWTVLICLATVGAACAPMFLWFLAALVFRWRFQFSILALLVLVLGRRCPVQLAGDRDEALRENRKKRSRQSRMPAHRYVAITRRAWTTLQANRPGRRGCAAPSGKTCWET